MSRAVPRTTPRTRPQGRSVGVSTIPVVGSFEYTMLASGVAAAFRQRMNANEETCPDYNISCAHPMFYGSNPLSAQHHGVPIESSTHCPSGTWPGRAIRWLPTHTTTCHQTQKAGCSTREGMSACTIISAMGDRRRSRYFPAKHARHQDP